MTLTFLTKEFYNEEYLLDWDKNSKSVISSWEEDVEFLSTFGLGIDYVKNLLKEALSFEDWYKAAVRIEKYSKLISIRQNLIIWLEDGDEQPNKEALILEHNNKIKKLERRMLKYEIMTLC